MTATPEQWAAIKRWSDNRDSYMAPCLLELRSRIEALEAAATREKDAPICTPALASRASYLADLLEDEADEDDEFDHTRYITASDLRAAAELLRTFTADEVKPVVRPAISTLTVTGKWGDVFYPDRVVVNGKVYEAVE